MNLVLQYARERDPRFNEVPDDELTRYIGERHPEFLQDPQFKTVFEARQQQAANTADTERATGAVGLAKETAKVMGGDAVEASRQLNDTAATLREMPVKAAGRLINWTGQMLAEDVGNVLTATTRLDPAGPVFQGLKESGRVVPQVGAAMALQAVGVPAPLAFGLPAGASTYEATGDVAAAAKSASVGAVIPGAASGARQLTGKALAAGLERGVGPVSSTVQKAVEAVGSQGGVQALMEGMNLPEYIEMTPEQRREAIVRNAFANLAFLPMDLPTIRSKGPSATREAASERVGLALDLRELVNDPQVIERLVALADEEALLATAPPRTELPIPEPPETLRAQFSATLDPDSSKSVTLLVPGTPDLAIPQGLEVVEVPQGFAVFNPKKVAEGTVRQAGAGGHFDGRLLGMSQPTKPTGPVVAVTTKAPDGSPEVVGELVNPKAADIAKAAEAQQKAVPGGTTEIRPPEEVLAERLGVSRSPQAPTPVAETITGQVNERIGSEGLTGGNPRRDPMPAERQGRPTPASAAGLPPVAPGFVRMYHGGTDPTGKWNGDRDVAPRIDYAAGYAAKTDSPVWYVDVPESAPFMVKAWEEFEGGPKAPWINTKVPAELMRNAKQVPPEIVAQEFRPDAETQAGQGKASRSASAAGSKRLDRPWDLIDHVESNVGKINLRLILEANPDFKPRGAARRIFTKTGGTAADVAADAMARDGLYKGDPGMVDQFAEALNEAASGRQGNRKMNSEQRKATAEQGKQLAQFEQKVLRGQRPKKEAGNVERVGVDALVEGDIFKVQDQEFTVQRLEWDPETGELASVVVKDGPKFGVQRIDPDNAEVIHVDRGTYKPAEVSTDFLPPEDQAAADFNLESVTPEQLKAEEAARTKAAADQKQREEIARRQAAPLSGDSSDVGQGALFQEDANLFSGPSAERSRGSRGAEATVGQAYPGGPLGEAPTKPADIPGYSAFPTELPEAVKFARELAGGAYPKLRERLRILGGRALGVFRHNDAAGQASIEMRRDIFDLPPSERRRLREEAQKYAEAAARPGEDVAQLAARRYEFLKREAFKENPVMALKVLWHEIGHWVDWLPDHMVSGRGNLLGRLASLKDYLRHTLPEGPDVPDRPITDNEKAKMRREAEKQLRAEIESGAISEIVRTILVEDPTMKAAGVTPDDVRSLFGMDAREKMPEIYQWFAEQPGEVKKEIVKAAMKGVVDSRLKAVADSQKPKMREETVRMKTMGPLREPTAAEIRERFQKHFREELARRRLVQLSQIKAELEPMIAWWRGTETMEDYFRKSSEMYAEAFSIFANNPAALEKRAPTYYRVLRNYLSRKPEVAKLYREIQDSLASGTIMRDRVEDLRRSWRDDDENSLARAFNAEKTKPRAFLDNVLYHIDDRLGPVYQVARRAGALGGKLREAAGNYRYRATEHERLLARVNREVVEPLAAEGVDREMLAEYMFHKHVTESRFVKDRETGELRMIGNSMGWAPKNSLERLAEMKTQLGPDGFAKVEAAQQRFRQIYEEQVVDLVRRSGLASPELMQAIEERTFYSTFSKAKGEPAQDGIAQLIEETYGAGPGGKIYRQVGNLGEIKNPFTATVMKSLALTSAAYRNILKRQTVAAMLEHDAGNIKPADVRWTGERMEPVILGEQKGAKVGTIVLLDQGQVKAYYVPKAVAEAIEGGPVVDNLLAMTAMKGLGQFKALFTQLNYGFWPVAFARDVVAWQMQLPGAGPKGYLKHIGPAMKAAKESLNGRRYNKAADLALKRKMLISRADTRGLEGTVADEFDLKVASYGLDPVKWGETDNKVGAVMRIWQAYQHLGQTLERAQKIAGMTYLDENFPTMPEWQKQEMVRERAGSPDFLRKGASAPYVDWVMMFFNPWKEGVRSLAKSARENPFSFSAKTLAAVVAPTILQSLAVNGLFGDDAKELYGSVPDYDLTNYLVVPLGWVDREKKKAAYFRLPLWEPARLMHGALFQGLTDRGRGVLSFAGGQIPGLNPILGTGSMWWDYYVSGRNPYDNFRGRELLTDDQFRVGGSTAFQELMKQTWNSAGGGIIHRFQNIPLGEPEPGRLEKFLQAPVVSNSLGRWIKVSNRGVFDRDRRAAEQVLQDDALMREAVRMMVDKNLATPPETFTEAEKVLHRDPKARRYFDELRTKVKASRRSLQEQREQKLPTKEARREALR